MAKKKSLVECKGRFKSFGELCTTSDLADKKVEVLETPINHGVTLREGERGIILILSYNSGYARYMKDELPVFSR